MTRDILIKNDGFTQYYQLPLVADDVQAYRVVYPLSTDMTGTLKITAKRADGATVVDTAQIEGKTAYYTLKNNMYNVVGETVLRITLIDSTGMVLTNKEIVCTVVEANGAADLTGDDRVPALASMIAQATHAGNYAQAQGDYAKQTADDLNINALQYRGVLPSPAGVYYTFEEIIALPNGKYYVNKGDYYLLNMDISVDYDYSNGWLYKETAYDKVYLNFTNMLGNTYQAWGFDDSWTGYVNGPVFILNWNTMLSSEIDSDSEVNAATSLAVKIVNNKIDSLLRWGEWYTPTLLNGWTGSLQYRKNGLGEVQFSGSVSGGTGNAQICILPEGFRPANAYNYLLPNQGTVNFARGYISTGGSVFLTSTSSTTVFFDGIRFDTLSYS